MAKITNPIRFSDYFQLKPRALEIAGALDPMLSVDTNLFIDPMLLEASEHEEMREARNVYKQHFSLIIKLLRGSQTVNDAAWRAAFKQLSFPEIKWTCLGYGGQSVAGSGSGGETTNQIIHTAKQIIELGVDDPDLFVAMALFEDGFGPDRISDMTTNVIFPSLLKFTERVLGRMEVPLKEHELQLRNGGTFQAKLPANPFLKTDHL